ncbi:MAG TPA: hypothetical protein VNQ77_14130 [Frankiaceae bacterium]|nr:hypothetical protein [Frankiaceae bacterium]
MSASDVLGLIGVLFALYQIRKAERAALAAKKAIEATSAQVNVYSLLLLVTDLMLVERDLERVAISDQSNETLSRLRDWQAYASDLRGLLAEHPTLVQGLDEKVQESMVLATQSRSLIAKRRAKPEAATTKIRAVANEVVLLARTEAARVRANVPVPEPVPTLNDDLMSAWGWAMNLIKRK